MLFYCFLFNSVGKNHSILPSPRKVVDCDLDTFSDKKRYYIAILALGKILEHIVHVGAHNYKHFFKVDFQNVQIYKMS